MKKAYSPQDLAKIKKRKAKIDAKNKLKEMGKVVLVCVIFWTVIFGVLLLKTA